MALAFPYCTLHFSVWVTIFIQRISALILYEDVTSSLHNISPKWLAGDPVLTLLNSKQQFGPELRFFYAALFSFCRQ